MGCKVTHVNEDEVGVVEY